MYSSFHYIFADILFILFSVYYLIEISCALCTFHYWQLSGITSWTATLACLFYQLIDVFSVIYIIACDFLMNTCAGVNKLRTISLPYFYFFQLLTCLVCPGVVKSKRSIWRLRTITDFFWAIVNFIGAFFATMFSMEKSNTYKKGSGSSKKWDGGPGGPGSGPYGGGGGGPRRPPRGLDNVRGIDHNALPACGSCCGG